MDRSSFSSSVFALFLDTSSTAAIIYVVFLDTFLNRWLDTSRHLYLSRITEALYIGLSRSGSHFLDFSEPVHLPNHSLSLQTSFPSIFQAFSRISLHLVSFDSLIFMHFILWNLSFWDFCKIWGFSKSKRFLWNVWDGFWRFTLKNFMHCILCAL